MFEKLRAMLVEQLGIDEDKITMESSFADDLEVDSLDLIEMICELEDEYDIEINTDELENVTTVGAMVEYLKTQGVE